MRRDDENGTPVAKRKGKAGRDARRDAQLARLTRQAGAGEERRSRDRDAAAREASVRPSAARWWTLAPTEAGDDRRPAGRGAPGSAVVIDVVADLLALDPRTDLRGRGGDRIRRLASTVDGLVTASAVTPSGRPLLDVVVEDPATRDQFVPSFDLDDLLSDAPVPSAAHDRAVRLADALLERAATHRDGGVDLHAEVAPVGVIRHERADEIETLVRVATDGLVPVPGPDPAIVTVHGGWIGVSPVELFLGAAAGLLDDGARDVGGAGLVAWLQQVVDAGDAPWWRPLVARIPVEPHALLDAAASRAGSDHPDVAGAALVELIALRHPLTPGP